MPEGLEQEHDLLQNAIDLADLDLDDNQMVSICRMKRDFEDFGCSLTLFFKYFFSNLFQNEEVHFQPSGALIKVSFDIDNLDQEAKDKLVTELGRKLSSNVCILCTKEFRTNDQLESHFWDHTDDSFQLQCLICDQPFFSKDDLLIHVKGHIPNEVASPTSPLFKLSK